MTFPKIVFLCASFVLACQLKAGTVLFNSTAQASAGEFSVFGIRGYVGPLLQSFSTGASSGPLSNLELSIASCGCVTGNTFDVGLYSASDVFIANLATISDSAVGSGFAVFDVPLLSNPSLAANTQYVIQLSSASSFTSWSFTTDVSGPGVSGQFNSTRIGPIPVSPSAFQMEVEVAPTPEPSYIVILVGAAAYIALKYRRN